jgi:hypothetical protein
MTGINPVIKGCTLMTGSLLVIKVQTSEFCPLNSSIPNGKENRQFIPFGMEECLELDELTEIQLSQLQLQNQLIQLPQL